MMRVSGMWHKWVRWLRDLATFPCHSPARPPSMALAVFLQDSAKGGRTAADGVLKCFKWMHRHLGFDALPLEPPLLNPVSHHPPEVLKQAPEHPLKVWVHLIAIASRGPGNLSLLASVVLYTGVLCLRSKHAQRHSFMHEQCTHRTLMGEVF